MRKTKSPQLKAARTLTTGPASFAEWWKAYGGTSHAVQQLTAASVTGITLAQMESMYSPEMGGLDNRLKKSPWSREYIRMARWMLEGRILAFSVESDTLDVLLAVQWILSPGTPVTWVRIRSDTHGFERVCYDSVEASLRGDTSPADVENRVRYEYSDTLDMAVALYDWSEVAAKMPPLKFRVMKRWILASMVLEAEKDGRIQHSCADSSCDDLTDTLHMLSRIRRAREIQP